MAFEGEIDEAVDELFVGEAGGLPQLWVHGDRGEAGHSVDLINKDAGLRFFLASLPLGFAGAAWRGGLHEEVDAGEAGAVAGVEGGEGHRADLLRFGLREFGGDDGDGWVLRRVGVLGDIVVELAVGDLSLIHI